MTIWAVIWVVLMILWPLGGWYGSYDGPAFNGGRYGAYCLIPWACVLILGLVMFGAVSGGSLQSTTVHHQ